MLTGITANALSRYNEATEQIEKSMNRLAKGTRDLDSHDQVRVSRFDNKIHSLKTAHSIVKQNQDLLRSALAGTDAVESITRKMRDLAKEAQDDQLTDSARAALVTEYTELSKELNYVAKNTEYDGTELLDGSFGTKEFTVGGTQEDRNVNISLGDLTLEGLKIGEYENDIGGGNTETIAATTLNSAANAEDAIVRLDAALATLETERAETASEIERFDFTLNHMTTMIGLNEEQLATLTDLDEAAEMARLADYQIQQQTAMALMAQAQQLSASVLQLLGG
tara:strand:+ start:257 stop:1099 length:843 start_codon:yes stop_codon:yes gene_type:complete